MSHLLRSRALTQLGFRHGFNLRTGGHSQGAYASFNLGRAVGDDANAVAENHRAFAREVGYAPGALFELSQVHGADARVVAEGQDPARVRSQEGDAVIAPAGSIAIGVRVADCVALLAADSRSGAVAAIHAGWRGVVRGMIGAGISTLLAEGAGRTERLAVAIFPHIRACCFEVGEDVAEQIARASHGAEVIERGGAKPHVALVRSVRAQLVALGVASDQIDDVGGCTRCEPERFFSYRRDGAHSGRHLAAILSR
jgi:YfiH family protein